MRRSFCSSSKTKWCCSRYLQCMESQGLQTPMQTVFKTRCCSSCLLLNSSENLSQNCLFLVVHESSVCFLWLLVVKSWNFLFADVNYDCRAIPVVGLVVVVVAVKSSCSSSSIRRRNRSVVVAAVAVVVVAVRIRKLLSEAEPSSTSSRGLCDKSCNRELQQKLQTYPHPSRPGPNPESLNPGIEAQVVAKPL